MSRRKSKPKSDPPPPTRRPIPWGYVVGVVVFLGTGLWVFCRWPTMADQILFGLLPRLALLGVLLFTAAALGAALLWLLGIRALPRPLALLASTALGIGAYSVILLTAGLGGLLGPVLLYLLPTASIAIGAVPLWRLVRRSWPIGGERVVGRGWNWAAVALIPMLAICVAAVNVPPGILWTGNFNPEQRQSPSEDAADPSVDLEGRGYDVLEYHLQVPREYLANGRISFLPHNVYSNYPQNASMWFLLLMGQVDPPQSAGKIVHTFNLLLAILAVAGVYVTARLTGAGGRADAGGGSLAALAVAGVPMLAAVAVVAYDEPMMLMFFSVALAMMRHYQLSADSPVDRGAPLGGYALAIGLLLGMACGTKYLALPFMVLPLGLGYVLTGGLTRLTARRKVRLGLLVAAGVVIAFAPWLIRTAALSGGNPVYPLMWKTFDGGDWTAADAARWEQGHLPDLPPEQRALRAWWRFFSHSSFTLAAGGSMPRAIFSSSLYGPWLWLLCWPIFFTRRRCRWDWLLLAMALSQLTFWIFVTHVPGRFILPVILPLGLLVGRSMAAVRPLFRWLMVALMLSWMALSFVQISLRFENDTRALQENAFVSAERLMMEASPPWGPLNRRLGDIQASERGPARVWVVGDARPFYYRYPVHYNVVFSHDPLADVLKSEGPAAAREILRKQGVRFVLVDWVEVRRLGDTYGFSDAYTPQRLRAMGRTSKLFPAEPTDHPANQRYWLIDLAAPPTTQPATGAAARP